MASEPARLVGFATAAVTTILALLAYFGIGSEALSAIIVGGIASVGPVVAGLVIRQKVFSPKTVREMVRAGVEVGLKLPQPPPSSGGATLYKP